MCVDCHGSHIQQGMASAISTLTTFHIFLFHNYSMYYILGAVSPWCSILCKLGFKIMKADLSWVPSKVNHHLVTVPLCTP